MPRTRRVLIGAGLALVATGLLWHFTHPTPATSTEGLFSSSFVDASGTPHPLAQWQGNVLVVNFWASWCPPCRDEMPALSAFQQKYAAKGVQLVGISAEDVETLKATKQEFNVSYPLLAADAQAMPLAAALGNSRSVLPFTVVIDKQGKISSILSGKINNSALEKAVLPLL